MQLVANKSIIIVAVLALTSFAQDAQEYRVTRESTERIKEEAKTWTPYEFDKNPFAKETDLRKRAGLIIPQNSNFHQKNGLLGMMLNTYKGLVGDNGFRKANNPVYKNEDRHKLLGLPLSFDARVQWPSCIGEVRNQESCGSCYAFSSALMLQDRFCIASQGQIKVALSPEDMVTCDPGNGGCNGGLLTSTINYLITEGVVSEDCKPYKSGIGIQNFCSYSCEDKNKVYEKYACKLGSGISLTTHEDIMTELSTNGPMQVGFLIYDDFYSYSNGIYETTPSSYILGGHAVKLLGWNYDINGRLYWICQNQWSTVWGMDGYFNIYAGQCGLDAMASACAPDLTFF